MSAATRRLAALVLAALLGLGASPPVGLGQLAPAGPGPAPGRPERVLLLAGAEGGTYLAVARDLERLFAGPARAAGLDLVPVPTHGALWNAVALARHRGIPLALGQADLGYYLALFARETSEARRARAAQDRGSLDPEAREAVEAIAFVTRQQPAVRVLDTVDLDRLRPAGEVALGTVDYLAVRWDGPPETATRRLGQLGWLARPHVTRLVYLSGAAEPGAWRAVQRAGVPHAIYCPPRLLDRRADVEALRPFLSASSYPFPRP